MALLVNNSQRPMSIGGKLLSPHVPQNIDDSYLTNSRIQKLMQEKVLGRAEGGVPKTTAQTHPNAPRAQAPMRPGRGVPPAPPEPPKS